MPFALIIRERGSSWAGRDPITTLHPTRKEAQAELASYVREQWDLKMDTDPPEDDDELIDEYFAHVLESYDIAEAV